MVEGRRRTMTTKSKEASSSKGRDSETSPNMTGTLSRRSSVNTDVAIEDGELPVPPSPSKTSSPCE